MKSGIYCITNTLNGKKYYGSTVNLEKRKSDHFALLRGNKHPNKHLQNAWNKYGEDKFVFTVIQHVQPEQLLDVEQQWIDRNVGGYNICKIAGNSLGVKHTEEAKQRIREAKIGHAVSDETRKKLSISHKGLSTKWLIGRKLSDETKSKLREKSSSRRHTEETKERMRGHSPSEESRQKMSEARRLYWQKKKEAVS